MREIDLIKELFEMLKSRRRIRPCFEQKKWFYYIAHDAILLRKFSFDSSGIPYFEYKEPIGGQYTPVITALFALDVWNKAGGLTSNDQEGISRFLVLADWFLKHAEEFRGRYGWFYHFNWDCNRVQLSGPWLSAMGNGMGISTLVRAWLVTGREEYLHSCERALEIFEYPISNGGVRAVDNHGCVWFEEYPVMPELHVLNGFIFSLFGLYDLSRLGNRLAKLLFLDGVTTLKKHIEEYDLGYWSSYDLCPNLESNQRKEMLRTCRALATGHYHAIHVQQLYTMYHLTDIELFKKVHLRWLSYYRPINYCRLFLNIIKEKIN
jgi:heparosan-N-sulfate-glucuronate 5-epimerase